MTDIQYCIILSKPCGKEQIALRASVSSDNLVLKIVAGRSFFSLSKEYLGKVRQTKKAPSRNKRRLSWLPGRAICSFPHGLLGGGQLIGIHNSKHREFKKRLPRKNVSLI